MTVTPRSSLKIHKERDMPTASYWTTTHTFPTFPALDRDIEVDVVVVGAGLTGITTAYLLKHEGVRVALLERDRIAAGDTSRTTAHLTYVTDARLHQLADTFGRDAAKAFWEAGAAAIDTIAAIACRTRAACDFRWMPGYLHVALRDQEGTARHGLEKDLELAQRFGFDATFVEQVPVMQGPGVRFAHQATFHPLKYLDPLVRAIPGEGSFVFEQTALEEVDDTTPMVIQAGGRTIRCAYLVIATHNPLMGKQGAVTAALFQTKLALYTSYVLGARVPKGLLPDGLWWDTGEPYDYLRVDPHADHDYVIFGGADVKTGQEEDTNDVFQQLQERLHRIVPTATIQQRWLGQVVETDDGLPFIGEHAQREFIATGFCGNGFTLGTLSAMMARDRYLERKNPWFDLFRVDRRPFHGGLWRYVTENLDYPYYLLRDRIAGADTDTLDEVHKGEGKIVRLHGQKVAAYRDDAGHVTLCSPVCTHLKCLVRWNTADRTWDCPCHGSRFHATGAVLSGPAEDPLEPLDLAALQA
jgi:glycine/D-amino acid oxidase-like deaminating enzyme/nitrite reductase/ring-hydroxylating ferredoxin subunit